MRRIVLMIALCLACAPRVGEVIVGGDVDAVGAKLIVDGVMYGEVHAERYRGDTIIADSSAKVTMWGDEQPGDTLLRPGDTIARARLSLSGEPHTVLVVSVAGESLRAAIRPRTYNWIRLSFKRNKVRVEASDD